jgi:hypothetical protein
MSSLQPSRHRRRTLLAAALAVGLAGTVRRTLARALR